MATPVSRLTPHQPRPSHADPLAPSRGIILGFLAGIVAWATALWIAFQ